MTFRRAGAYEAWGAKLKKPSEVRAEEVAEYVSVGIGLLKRSEADRIRTHVLTSWLQTPLACSTLR